MTRRCPQDALRQRVIHSHADGAFPHPPRRRNVPTMTTPKPDRKIGQLRSDVDSIYEILGRVEKTQTRHSARFTKVDSQLVAINGRLDGHDARFDGIDARFDQHDARFDGIERRLDQHDSRFDQHDTRFDTLESKVDQVIEILRGKL